MNMYARERTDTFFDPSHQGCVKRTSLAVNVLLRCLGAPSRCTNEEESRYAENTRRIISDKFKIIFRSIMRKKIH